MLALVFNSSLSLLGTAVTKYYRLGGLNRNVFSHSFGG